MGHILLYDRTANKQTPKADISIAVDASCSLSKIIEQLVFSIDHTPGTAVPGCYNELHIICGCSASGLMLGGGINHENVAKLFKPLRYKIGNIIIHCESSLLIYTKGNNGVLLCRKLALSVFANVTASVSIKDVVDINYPAESPEKIANSFDIKAVWNCAGKIKLLTKYDANGKIIYSVNCPGNHAVNLLMNVVSSMHSLTESRSLSIQDLYQKILNYWRRFSCYLHLYRWKPMPIKHL
jgi:hypothetical protein